MKYIEKKSSPLEFETWKASVGKAAKYKSIPDDKKDILRKSLLSEQFGLCCYCGKKLTDKDMHIEHLKPQSTFSNLQLEYENLLLSCMGKKYVVSEEEELDFCGHGKSNWYDENLFLHPLIPECESEFFYLENGTIKGATDRANETIRRLGLGTFLLNNQREKVIEGILDSIEDLEDMDQIQDTINYLLTLDDDGNLHTFSFVLIEILKSYLVEV